MHSVTPEPSGYHAAQTLSQIIPHCAPNMPLHSARALKSFCFHSIHNKCMSKQQLRFGFPLNAYRFSRGRKCRFFPCEVVKHIYSAVCLHLQYCHFWYLSSARHDSGYKWWYFWAVSDRQACANDKDRILSLLPPFLFYSLDSEGLCCWWSCTHTVRPPKGGHLQLGRGPETNIWFL